MMAENGTATISIEIELGWGMHDQGEYDHLSPDRTAEDDALDWLLDLCDSLKVPISFDIVGHLLHGSCSGVHSGPHQSDWWSEDPGSDASESPLFYAPDLVSKIEDSDVGHEICTHTYSHALADELSNKAVRWELERANDLHTSAGLPQPRSIVLPRHQSVNLDLLDDTGFDTIRIPFSNYSPPRNDPLSKWLWLHFRSHPTSRLEHQDEISISRCTPGPSLTSTVLPNGQKDIGHPSFQILPLRIRQYLHKRYLTSAVDRAIKNQNNVHLWTHLFNMSNNAQRPPIKRGLQHLSNMNNSGKITIMTMNELGKDDGF